jgi:hypothetical protein
MRRLTILFLVLFAATLSSYAQTVYFKTGINNTAYDFKDQNGEKVSGLVPGVGSSFEMGIGLPLAEEWFKYELGLSLDSYNATGGDLNNNYSWNTNYGGVKNTITFFPTSGEFNLGILAVAGASTIFNGSQVINNSRYELRNNPEFKGLLLQAGLGLSLSYNIFNQGFLSLQYDYSKSFRVGEQTDEKLSYLNNRILFGIHFQLD